MFLSRGFRVLVFSSTTERFIRSDVFVFYRQYPIYLSIPPALYSFKTRKSDLPVDYIVIRRFRPSYVESNSQYGEEYTCSLLPSNGRGRECEEKFDRFYDHLFCFRTKKYVLHTSLIGKSIFN